MKFEEIFNEDGLYVADSFREGVCISIEDGVAKLNTYESASEFFPRVDDLRVYRELFNKDYRRVLTRQSLFKKEDKL